MTTAEKEALIRRYEKLQTSLVSDAMDELSLNSGAGPGMKLCAGSTSPAAGFAVTMRQVRQSAGDTAAKARHAQVIDDVLGECDMLVIRTDRILDETTGGGLLAQRAKRKGAAGFVTDESMRDLDEIDAMAFPVCCAGTSPVRSLGRLETVSVNETIQLRGVSIAPGDVILMDTTGLIVVPLAQAAAVAERAEQIMREEDAAMRFICEGKSIREARTLAGKLP